MKFGLFDHVDQNDRPLVEQFDDRLKFAAAADEAGFACLLVAEHHGTPLNMVPNPAVYLSAVARATKKMRLGALVFLLPLYSPLRLIEEIAMLDHLSHGRLEVGVGRGVSPFELNFHKVNHDQSREIFLDAYDCILKGLTSDELNHEGPFFTYKNVPMALRPLQKPYPPIWYASSAEFGSRWAGERGLHFGTLGNMETAKKNLDAYKDAFAKAGSKVAHPKPEYPGGVVIGVNRQVVVAETAEEARRIAQPAHEQHHEKITWLLKRNVNSVNYTQHIVGGYDSAVAAGTTIVGTPDHVRAELERQIKALGVNHMNLAMFFGNMKLDDALRSQKLFATEVMPKLASL
ncbi:MAG TPA: LLM class flavin-dependent oxidoreductase [Stellaceae bacterium]|jgi:alkanesulfonate monooxygenase SsuD/methylene tetrahydromethanopterin reductase-like flavin-dependent oxidoreductase (luciferase family)|nr:LLM class flavin-dependent oxidoreductase [Stellaceae bacterium]